MLVPEGSIAMGISDRYSAEVRKHLSYFPTWEPGDNVSPGDVGELIKGVFHRQTTLPDLFSTVALSIERDAKPNTTAFQSAKGVTIQTKGEGTTAGTGAVKADVSAQIVFSREGAVLYHALNSTRRYITNLLEVRQHIDRHRESWPKGHVLVSHVEDAERFAVFISSAAGESVNLTGNVNALEKFELADASLAVTAKSNVGYQRISSGPILLRLYGFGFFGGVKLLSREPSQARSAAEEFEELSARDPAHD
jgi:hypothetical protein